METKMSAKEMFEELGYTRSEDNYFIEYEKNFNEIFKYTIVFSKEYECIELFSKKNGETHYFFRISKRVLKAINKQVEELGWK